MKKHLLITLTIGLLTTATAQAQDFPALGTEPMPVVADIGASILKPDGSVFTVYPAEVTLEGQWCDIALWKGPFSITDFPSFRVRLQRGTEEDGQVQLFARNVYSEQNYKGPYIPFKKNQTVIEGEFAEYDTPEAGGGWFDDDPICTWFALQLTNKDPLKRTVVITEATLIDEDGNEITSCNVRNGSWKPAPGWVEPDPLYEADVKFGIRDIVGLYSSLVDRQNHTAHRFTFNTREPLPEGFTFYVVLNDGDDTTYEYDVPAGGTSWTSPAVDDDYKRVYLQYAGQPMTLHFSSITRTVADMTGVSDAVSMSEVDSRQVYSTAGVKRSYREAHGLNIVRDRMADGTIRVKKVIK